MSVINNLLKISALCVLFVSFLTAFGCSSKSNIERKRVGFCYGDDSEIVLYYRNPEVWGYSESEIQKATNGSKTSIKISFQSNFKDTLEVFMNNRLIMHDYFISDYVDTVNYQFGEKEYLLQTKIMDDTGKSFVYDYSHDNQSPILTVKNLNKPEECFQLVLDTRYKFMVISRVGKNWFVTYSNF